MAGYPRGKRNEQTQAGAAAPVINASSDESG